jgi:hypothetical protein
MVYRYIEFVPGDFGRVGQEIPWVGRHVVPKKPLPVDQDETLGAAPAESHLGIVDRKFTE